MSEDGTAACGCARAGASLYAVWFGMPTEQLPYQAGAVVDAALQLSVYDSPGSQLSGRILELARRGWATSLAAQADLVGRCAGVRP